MYHWTKALIPRDLFSTKEAARQPCDRHHLSYVCPHGQRYASGADLDPKPGLIKWAGLGDENRPPILCEYAHAMGNAWVILWTTGKPFVAILGYRAALSGIGRIKV